MVFTSLNFLLFFPALITLFYVTPIKYRWSTLLIASYFFYLNIEPVYGFLTFLITLSTYFFTRLIDKVKDDKHKAKLMFANIVIVLLPLFFFKYFTAVNNVVFSVLELYEMRWFLPKINFLLPVGISFYTFMSIGYTIDVYNEEIEVEKNIGVVALFISFFPLILSGPIERAKNMMPQFKSPLRLNPAHITIGLKLMLWGYFMKLVIADRLAIYIDAIYGNLIHHNGDTILFTSLLYPIQVYADLGGYSLIAIGVSKILGLDVMHNFNRPFFATSMAGFWRRWHISLITWLTDYVYTPLSFSFRKYKQTGIALALMITFFLSGIWHGATLNFIVWGLLQGIFLSVEAFINKRKIKNKNRFKLESSPIYIIFSIATTYILFSISQVFGRALTFGDSLYIFRKILFERGSLFLDKSTLAYGLVGVVMLFLSDLRDEFFPKKILLFNNSNVVIRFCSYISIALIILWIGVLNGGQFIYFKF